MAEEIVDFAQYGDSHLTHLSILYVTFQVLKELPHIRKLHTEYLVDTLVANPHASRTFINPTAMAMFTHTIGKKPVASIPLVLALLIYGLFNDGALQFGDDTFVIAVV